MCTWLLCGLSILDWVGILIKEEGFFAKHPEPWLNATRPLFGMERGRASKQEQVLINLIYCYL